MDGKVLFTFPPKERNLAQATLAALLRRTCEMSYGRLLELERAGVVLDAEDDLLAALDRRAITADRIGDTLEAMDA